LSWDPDDPRLDELANALADNLLTDPALMTTQAGHFAGPDTAARYDLVNAHRAEEAPTLARLTALVEARLRAAGIDIPHR
jgi:hypothetical protein